MNGRGINLQHSMLIDRFLNTFIHRYYKYIHSLNRCPNSICEYKLASMLTMPALFLLYRTLSPFNSVSGNDSAIHTISDTHELSLSREIQVPEMHR